MHFEAILEEEQIPSQQATTHLLKIKEQIPSANHHLISIKGRWTFFPYPVANEQIPSGWNHQRRRICVNKRTAGKMNNIELGMQHHSAGRLADAEAVYRQVLETEPDHPTALHMLGVVAYQAGKPDLAFPVYQPQEGLLVMWPSYLYHQTIPFHSGGIRSSIPGDLLPLS